MTRYRADIDGLRAVAIVPVVLFHHGFRGFSGGFVGVDVFFVISGFLITSLIQREIDEGQFSIARFYERRIRRIFPALFTVLVLVTAAAFVLLVPPDRRTAAASALAATLFWSNVHFWQRSGYFDRTSESDPLLHTWSLSVEEQFYVVFPLLLLLLARFAPARRAALYVLFAASLAGSAWAVAHAPTAAFFLLPTRFWELLLGALLATARWPALPPRVADALSGLGLALIAIAVVAFSGRTPFPGLAALLPCVGTALVVHAGPDAAPNRALSWRPFVGIGLISYSLYLWHWPVLVFARYLAFPLLQRELRPVEHAGLIAVSTALAVLSWRFVETPFRHAGFASRRVLFSGAAVAMAGTCALAVFVLRGPGLVERRQPTIVQTDSRVLKDDEACANWTPEKLHRDEPCRLGAPNDASIVVFGDSHAHALVPAVDEAARAAGRGGHYIVNWGCPPLLGVTRKDGPYASCPAMTNAALDVIRQRNYRTVIVDARWTSFTEGRHEKLTVVLQDESSQEESRQENRKVLGRGLARTLEALAGREIILVGPTPELRLPGSPERLKSVAQADVFGMDMDAFEKRARAATNILKRQKGVTLVWPQERLCPGVRCAVTLGNEVLYQDEDHLSRAGARLLVPLFEPLLRR